jgi:NAD(P)-dependent dehydrogenase (short-subunit alcohol dehydrogenase family)
MLREDTLRAEVVIVTGGGTGLGRAMATAFAALGAKVGVMGRRPQPLQEVVDAITVAGGTATLALGDIRDPAQVSAAFDALEQALGPCTTLVNNAAGNFLACSEDLSPNAFDAVVRIVLHGSFHCTREAGRRWIERGTKGQVLSIVTTYAWTGSAFVVPSACAKAGVLAMTKSLAVEWATYGIRLNAIAPGPFPTEGAFSKLMPTEMEDEAKGQIPLGRFGEPHELAGLAAFMVSPMAAYMTGECVVLDGGEHLRAGQEFSRLVTLPRDGLKQMFSLIKAATRG